MPGVSRSFVALVCVLAGACSAGGDDASGDDDNSGAPAPATASGECLDHSSTVRRHTPAGNENVSLLDANVLDPEGCVDVVVFEFRSDGRQLPPGYSAEYEDGPFRDFTSGDEFEPSGEAYLVLRFAKTSVFTASAEPGEEPEPTYTGRESIDPSNMNHLQEVRIIQASEEDEGMIVWVVGLDSKRPYNIDASMLPLPLPSDTTTTTTSPDPAGSTSSTSSTTTTTSTTSPPTTTSVPTEATSKIVLRIG